MKVRSKYLFTAYILFILYSNSSSQIVEFSHITSKDGLSNSNINCIAQDDVGFIWIGTENGLNCYNGYSFNVYRFNPSDSTTIASNAILSIHSDSKDNLWIGSRGGISRYIKEYDRFVNYNLSGLSFPTGITVNSIKEDKKGHIWLGTSIGLYRYNAGQDKFEPVFQHEVFFNRYDETCETAIKNGIPKHIVDKTCSVHSVFFKNMNEFRDTLRYYLGSIDYQNYSDLIERIFIIENSDVFSMNDINAVETQGTDIIWLGYSNGNILKYYPGSETYSIVYLNPEMIQAKNVISIYDDVENIWIGTLESAYKYDKNENIFVKESKTLNRIFRKKSIRFYNAGDDKIWITTDDGLVLYDKNTDTYAEYKHSPNDPNTLASNFIRGFLLDHQKNIWVGCRFEGVDKSIQKKWFQTFSDLGVEGRFNTNMVSAIHVDRQNNIWTGYYTGGMDIVMNHGELIKSLYDTLSCKNCLGSGTVFKIFEDHSGNIWIGTNKGGLQKYNLNRNDFRNFRHSANDPNSIANNDIRNILSDDMGNIWVSTFGKGLSYFQPDQGKFNTINTDVPECNIGSNWIMTFIQNNKGEMLIGYTNGLQKYSRKQKRFENIISDSLQRKLKMWDINYFYHDSENILWIGTTNGLYVHDANEYHMKNITKDHGLPDNTIKSIIEDSDGNIWVGTNYGLAKINRESWNKGELVISNYYTSDGLPSNNFQPSSCFRDKEGTLYFGTSLGLVFFNPRLIVTNPVKPRILISGIKLFEETLLPNKSPYLIKSISYTDKIILPYHQNFLTIQYVALNYVHGDKNQYAYFMNGIDKEWVYAGNQREVSYKNLPPGEYVFYVKASNNDGIWNETPAKLVIIIKPPLWLTTFAKIIYGLLIIFIIFFFRQRLLTREREKREQELKKAENEKQIEISNLKMKFFTNIAHEFRTPLTLITAPLENILGHSSDERVRSQAKLIQKNTQRLLRLVNQLMSLRRVQTGHLELQAKENDMIRFVQDIFNTFLYQADKKEITYRFTSDYNDLKTWFDQDKLDKILYNLISNAFKHTPAKGSIHIRICKALRNDFTSLPTEDDDRSVSEFVRIDIEDSGIGIPQQAKEEIFTRFYSTDSLEGDGTGIGLAITKELVELHHGYIQVESEEGKGTLFSVFLPLGAGYLATTEIVSDEKVVKKATSQHADISQEESIERISTYEYKDTEKMSVLIVEDDEDVSEFIRNEFKSEFNIYEAKNGKEAFDVVLKYYPDVIISDIMMPEMDGIEFCKQLKSDDRTNHLPVILLTARVNEESRLEGFEVGADAYIEKPFSPKLLKTRINNLLKSRQRMRERFGTFSLSKSSPITGNPVDEKFLRKAIQVIEENLSDSNFSINHLCIEVGLSRSVLYSKIRSITNLSVNEFIRAIRLKKAVQYFQDGHTSVSDVAFMVGFKTLPHFSRCFSNEFRISPSEYIDKIRS